jgi:hypothetical protein
MALDLRTDKTYENYTKTYTTFSGADIVATIGGVPMGSLSAITWSVTREKAPVFTLGSPNPRSFSRGKRGIAGSMMFTTFDRPALYNVIANNVGNDNFKIWTRTWNLLPNMNSNVSGNIATNIVDSNSVLSGVTSVLPYYADQIPPFDVTVTFANEYGQAAVRAIYGVELINEGSGVSMDDIQIEESMTYVAREVGPMIPTSRGFDETDKTIDSAVVAGFGLSG